jgi:hypothetical protein
VANGSEWRSNTLAYSTDVDPIDGIALDGYIVADKSWAKELLSATRVDQVEITVIPTYGFAANGSMYLDYMSVKHWGAPGEWETTTRDWRSRATTPTTTARSMQWHWRPAWTLVGDKDNSGVKETTSRESPLGCPSVQEPS